MKQPKVMVRQTLNYKLVRQLRDEIFPDDIKSLPVYESDICWILWIYHNRYWYPSGFAILRPLAIDGELDMAYMAAAGLVKTARGKKLHKKLIDVRMQYCKRNEISHLITYVLDYNLASANSLINKGFRLYEPDWKYAGKRGVIYLHYEFNKGRK